MMVMIMFRLQYKQKLFNVIILYDMQHEESDSVVD